MPNPQSKTNTWKHQIAAWDKAQSLAGYYLAHNMGAGNSKAAVDICDGIDAKKCWSCVRNK